MKDRYIEFKDINRILVIKLRHIGDVLLTVPVFRALRENFPSAHIAALVNSGTEEVLTGNPLIDEIIVFDRSLKNLSILKRPWMEILFLKEIRKKEFDMTFDLTGSDRTAIISFSSSAKYRFSFVSRKGFYGRRYMYSHLAKKDGSGHMVLQNLSLPRQVGIDTKDLGIDIYVPEKAKDFVKELFNIARITERDIVIHIHPVARWSFKCWKDEYMAEIISWLLDMGIKIIVTSSPDKKELEKTKKILSLVASYKSHHASRVIDLSGKTTIKQLAAVSQACDLFLGVDSASMHIASAVGTPVVVLFGPTREDRWGPWNTEHIILSEQMICKPCRKGSCEGADLRKCMEIISPEKVKEAVKRLLSHSQSKL